MLARVRTAQCLHHTWANEVRTATIFKRPVDPRDGAWRKLIHHRRDFQEVGKLKMPTSRFLTYDRLLSIATKSLDPPGPLG